MKIYTKTGDRGDTALYGGSRRSKADVRVVAYGDVDELQALLGVALADPGSKSLSESLGAIQNDLFVLSSELARIETKPSRKDPVLTPERVGWLEGEIDQIEATNKPLQNFILQGGVSAAAQLFLARAVCRRAERAVVMLQETEPVSPVVLQYLNRLSDFLFVAARRVNRENGVSEAEWKV